MYGKSICKYPKSVRRAVAVLGVAAGLSMAGRKRSITMCISFFPIRDENKSPQVLSLAGFIL